MENNDPVAFLSYVRADDEHDHGRITALRQRLEGEVRMHTGKKFKIFQDKSDIQWGQQWKERLDETLLNVTFLIPVVTPSYFNSTACREEFEKFLIREKQLGENTLILPIYYFESEKISDGRGEDADDIAKVISTRNWSDWRSLRFKSISCEEVETAISDMAGRIKRAVNELDRVISAAKAPPSSTTQATEIAASSVGADLSAFSPDIPAFDDRYRSDSKRKRPPRSSYYVYTKQFDEEVDAAELSDANELKRLQRLLKPIINSIERKNQFDINAAKIKIANLDIKNLPTVTILVDNSGSMRGNKILYTAAWSYIVVKILEEFGIKTEVLGFTTRAWKGGQAREKWLVDGKPKNPGRLNDVRHIIYKEFNQSATKSLPKLSLMIREGLLKENLDGEALLWAYDRIQESGLTNPVVVVLSDGAPVDDSTLSVNSDDFLVRHLVSTIEWLKNNSNLRIFGVGIEYNIKLYYENGVDLDKINEDGAEILKVLPGWLS